MWCHAYIATCDLERVGRGVEEEAESHSTLSSSLGSTIVLQSCEELSLHDAGCHIHSTILTHHLEPATLL